MERIASGYALAEAPVAASDGGLYFSDILAGGVHRLMPDHEAVKTVVPKRRGVGGAAIHSGGGLVLSGRDLVHVGDHGTTTLYADEALAGLNDLTVDGDGSVIVGTLRFRPFAGEEPVAGEFIRVGAGAEVLVEGVEWANGCALSPGGTTLYGCDYRRGVVLAADRREGGFGPPRVAIEAPGGEADGIAVDEEGAIWVALGGRGSIGRFRPDGALDTEIEVPAGFVSSLCFGGPDMRDLFITTGGDPADPEASGGVFLTRSATAGVSITPVA